MYSMHLVAIICTWSIDRAKYVYNHIYIIYIDIYIYIIAKSRQRQLKSSFIKTSFESKNVKNITVHWLQQLVQYIYIYIYIYIKYIYIYIIYIYIYIYICHIYIIYIAKVIESSYMMLRNRYQFFKLMFCHISYQWLLFFPSIIYGVVRHALTWSLPIKKHQNIFYSHPKTQIFKNVFFYCETEILKISSYSHSEIEISKKFTYPTRHKFRHSDLAHSPDLT